VLYLRLIFIFIFAGGTGRRCFKKKKYKEESKRKYMVSVVARISDFVFVLREIRNTRGFLDGGKQGGRRYGGRSTPAPH
jgi:hypothetical protein